MSTLPTVFERMCFTKVACAALALVGTCALAQSLPTGMQVTHGQATAVTTGNSLLNISATDKSVLQWQQFSIGAGNTVNFQLPSSSSQVLNQVTGGNPSQILGSLTSNGQVWLINPNGIVFGAGARVDVGALVASTLHLSADDFVAGRYRFSASTGSSAHVLNQGTIRTPYGGRIVLLGHGVQNSGNLQAEGGSVALLGVDSVELVDTGTPHMAVRAVSMAGAVANSGAVGAGTVDVYGAAINQQGSIVADSMGVNAHGEVVLRASGNVALAAGSQTQATAGGVTVKSDNGSVQVDGTVTVSATQGNGGSIRMDARQLFIRSSGQLLADGASVGDGGRIVLWGYDLMSQRGLVAARGGARGGNGGFVETSTHGFFDLQRIPVVGAPMGRAGNWLIDPYNITVVSAPPAGVSSNITLVAFGPPVDIYVAQGDGAVISVDLIQTALNNGTSVTLDTNAGFGTQPGNIYWNAPLVNLSPITLPPLHWTYMPMETSI